MLIKAIKITCIVGILTFLLHGTLAPFYELGQRRFTVPIFFIGIAVLILAFLRRKRWSWILVLVSASIYPVISIIYFPSEKYYGALTSLLQVIVLIEVIVCGTIFATMLMPAAKQWFLGSEIINKTNEGKEDFHRGEILEAVYRIYLWDMVWFNLYQTPRSRTNQISFVLLMFLTGFFLSSVFSNNQFAFGTKVLTYMIILTSILFGLMTLNIIVLGFIYFVRQFDIRAMQHCKLSISESGLISETPFKYQGLKWSGIEKIHQTSNYIMFYMADWAALLIPKRAFTNKIDAERFFDYSCQCLKKAKNVALRN